MTGASRADLAEAFRRLHTEPDKSEALLRAAGDDLTAKLMLAGALRLQGRYSEALSQAQSLAQTNPRWAGARFEAAMALGGLGRHAEALQALQELESLGQLPGLWREIGDRRWDLGDRPGAEQAYLRHLAAPPEALVHDAIIALQRKDAPTAERLLGLQLKRCPGDVLALRYLAELLSAADRYEESEAILRRCLERAPSFALARYGLAMVLFHDHRLPPALAEAERLLAAEPNRLEFLNLKADALGRLGDFDAAARCLQSIVALYPNEGGAWSNLGHILRALGRRDDCQAAYKRAIALGGAVGEAYWGLANLKTYRFEIAEIAAMQERLMRPIAEDDRIALLFALGKALEDEKKYEDAFNAYRQANAARRARVPHDPNERAEALRRARAVFTPTFFAERKGAGSAADDPIFIVGMPRSGSTLVEQILASHSRVEGTMELIELLAIARRLAKMGDYPDLLKSLPASELQALGQEYLDRTRIFRKTSAPRFIDKMPNNFTQIGLIHLILPNARIVDVRRHPLACGVSNFKQHWATGQTFAYDLADVGAFYRSYVELMAHFDAVLPGRVHRVIYENLVADPEGETRRLLEACGLPFEDSCLRFYENTRAVRTPSSEQVRQPIFSAGLESWRPFEPWLAPLKEALGPVLDSYPKAP